MTKGLPSENPSIRPTPIPAVHANISVRWRFLVSRLSELPPLQTATLCFVLPFRLHSVSSFRSATFHCVWRQRYFSIMPTQSLPLCSVPCGMQCSVLGSTLLLNHAKQQRVASPKRRCVAGIGNAVAGHSIPLRYTPLHPLHFVYTPAQAQLRTPSAMFLRVRTAPDASALFNIRHALHLIPPLTGRFEGINAIGKDPTHNPRSVQFLSVRGRLIV